MLKDKREARAHQPLAGVMAGEIADLHARESGLTVTVATPVGPRALMSMPAEPGRPVKEDSDA